MTTRRFTALFAVAALLLAACSGGGTNAGTTGPNRSGSAANGGSTGGAASRPGDVRPETHPARVSWVSTKHAEHYALINQSHPAAKRPIPLSAKTNVITDIQMGALLSYLEKDVGFFRLAASGFSARAVPRTGTNGYIVVERGGRTWGLVFSRGTRASASPIPTAYVKSKLAIIGAFNSPGAPQAYSSKSGDRVLGIDRIDSDGSGVRK